MHPTGGSHSHNHCLLVFLLLTVATLLLAACRPSPALEHPQMNGFLEPYGADGENWPPNVEVTIQVYDQPQGKVLFAGTSKTSEDGHFFQGLALTTLPGMMVAVAHGSERQSVVLVPLAIEDINPANDTVSGTATGGAKVFVYAGDNGKTAELWATTSGHGQWQADFSGQLDITETTTVQATIRDARGNGTVFKIDQK